jgi:hypothetical protein
MNNCQICKNELSSTHVDMSPHPIKVCLTCFFDESIPNVSSHAEMDAEDRRVLRTEAIRKRCDEIIERYLK